MVQYREPQSFGDTLISEDGAASGIVFFSWAKVHTQMVMHHNENDVNIQAYVRRVVIDSASVTGLATHGKFQCKTPDDMEHVRKVCVAEAIVISEPISGTITMGILKDKTRDTVIATIPAGHYDSDFDTFKSVVYQVMSTPLKKQYSGDVHYNSDYNQFELSGNVDFTSADVTISNQDLTDLLGWPSMSFNLTGSLDANKRIIFPSIRPYAWPRMNKPVYIHIDQIRSEQQGAGGAVEQVNSRGIASMEPDSLTGMRGALTHVIPQPLFVSCTSHAYPFVEFATPIAKMSRFDISVCTADGSAYAASRVFIVLDIYCDRK